MPYTVRTFEDFIRVDVATGDSDPVYWAVYRAKNQLGDEWATRFSLAMLAYYHMGVAAEAADKDPDIFWEHLMAIYHGAPRGSERRHFRGAAGMRSLETMRRWSPDPHMFFAKMPDKFSEIKKVCEKQLSGFGPYFMLKLVDYMDSCMGFEVRGMSDLAYNLPDEPAEALKIMFPNVPVPVSFRALTDQFIGTDILAAPRFTRRVGPAEIETSLCGWKTTKFKGNWFGAAIADKRRQLYAINTERCRQLMGWLPHPVPQDTFELQL